MERLLYFGAPLALLSVLLVATPSPALPPLAPPPLESLTEAEEDEAEEDEPGEGPEEEVVVEEEEEEAEAGPSPPGECVLQTASARVVAYPDRNRVRLLIRYTALASTDVTVEYGARGPKGSLVVGHSHQSFSRKGVFRLSERIGAAKMAKIRAAQSFTVTMHVPAAPSYCNQYYSRHLGIKRTARNQVVWAQSDPISGRGR